LQLLPFDGRRVVVGPLFVPGTTGCHRCFVMRRAACSGYEEDFDVVEAAPLRAVAPSAVATVAAALGAVVALRWSTTHDPSLPGSFYALEVGTILTLSHHRLLRVPRCTSCGPPARAVPSPWHQAAAS
jgi:bacteriocin biosynthesis cyclodehydratase domain-containing protein